MLLLIFVPSAIFLMRGPVKVDYIEVALCRLLYLSGRVIDALESGSRNLTRLTRPGETRKNGF